MRVQGLQKNNGDMYRSSIQRPPALRDQIILARRWSLNTGYTVWVNLMYTLLEVIVGTYPYSAQVHKIDPYKRTLPPTFTGAV